MFTLTRHEGGPILVPDANHPWEAEGIFNPGVIHTGSEVVMLYRAVGELEAYVSRFGLAKSTDGITFTRASAAPVFGPSQPFDQWGCEDPRIMKIDDAYYVTYVAIPERIMLNGESYPRTGPLETSNALLRTHDFLSYENLGIISPDGSDNKDGVLFPRKIGGRYVMLHRPTGWNKKFCEKSEQAGLTCPYGVVNFPEKPGIWIAYSDDLQHWTDHKVLLPASHHNDAKIGPGLPPIETEAGWLLIYHHVTALDRPDAFEYTTRAALFDLEDPTKLLGKLPYDILKPEMPYELERNSPIVFPTGGFVSDDTLHIYYGASDRYICLATGSLQALLSELMQSANKPLNNG